MSVIRSAAVALAATGLVLTGGAATAASKSVADRSGDAAPTADITRFTVENGDDELRIKVKLAKAVSGRTHLVATMTSPTEGGATYVARTVVLPAKGKSRAEKIGVVLETVTTTVTEPTEEGGEPTEVTETTPVECDGMKATLSSGRNGQSQIRVPQTCFGDDAGTLEVDVATATPDGDLADQVPGALRVRRG